MKYPIRWSPLILGVLLFAQGFAKVAAPHGYSEALEHFRVFGGAVSWASSTWAALEMLSGASLIGGAVHPTLRMVGAMGGAGGIVVSLAYLVLFFTSYGRKLTIANSTLFGQHLPMPVSIGLVFLEVAILFWSFTAFWRFIRPEQRRARPVGE